MRRAVVALIIAWTGIAAAQDAPLLTDPLATAITDGRFAEAYTIAGDLVAANGDDADVRYYAAVACLRTARFDEAARHVAAGLAAHADNADLLGLRAQILLFQGDEAGARAAADQALAILPDAGDAVGARDEIALGDQARARMAGGDPGLVAGSAPAFVDGLIADVARGAPPAEIARAFDLEILSSAPPSERTRTSLVRAIETALGEARTMRDQAGQKFFGWVTAADARPSGDRVVVDVLVPLESTITARQRAAIGAASADPQLRGTVDPGILALLDGVPEAEREALLDRMMGVHTRSLLELHFEVAGAAGDYRITDLAFGEISLKHQLGNFSKVIDKVDPPRSRWSFTPQLLGTVVGIVAGIIVLAFLLTRRRR